MVKVTFTEDALNELLFFSENNTIPETFPIDDLYKKQSVAVQIIRRNPDNPDASNIDTVLRTKIFPLAHEQLIHPELKLDGIWTPTNELSKGIALKLCFPKLSTPYKLPEIEPIPPHVAVCYEAFKYKDLMDLAEEYPGKIMKIGFFTSDLVYQSELIAKTVENFENRTVPPTFEEKVVIQLKKTTNGGGFLDFCSLGPTYISLNTVQGEEDCRIFFPIGYDDDGPERKLSGARKKSRKKSRGKHVNHAIPQNTNNNNNNNNNSGDDGDDKESLDGAIDKTTSPLPPQNFDVAKHV